MTTKHSIMQAALELFVQNGIDKTSTNSIAERAGVASGTVFVSFKTKQDLVNEIYLTNKHKIHTKLRDVIDPYQTYEYNFKKIARIMIEHYLASPHDFKYYLMIDSGVSIPHEIIEQSNLPLLHILEYMQQGIQDNIIKDIPIQLLKQLIWSTMEQIILYLLEHPQEKLTDRELNLIWDQIKV